MKLKKSGADLIAEERAAHFTRGYDPSHDDQHTDGALAYNAAHLIVEHLDGISVQDNGPVEIPNWTLWAGKDRIRCLVIAGALIAAEIDRLQRAGR